MGTQLVLVDTDRPSWKLDHKTREIGRRGVAEAREALRRASDGSSRPAAHHHAA